uniref:Signal peptidase I n=1 Tax=Candidatus Methanomethylicus mesodigestus TaxID=1867258 RepID=A0A7C3IXJ2_9CREN
MDGKIVGTAAVAALTYLAVYFVVPRIAVGPAFYFLTILSWVILIIVLFIMGKRGGLSLLRMNFSRDVIMLGVSVAIFQIVVLFGSGVIMGFGRNPYSLTPYGITINILTFSSAIIALEFARATIISGCSKRGMLWKIAIIAFLFTIFYLPPSSFIYLSGGLEVIKFIGSAFIPTLAVNLFATFLVALGGPSSSILYLTVIEAFQWISPILPNPTWTVKALIETLVPSFGFLIVSQFESRYKLIRTGILRRGDLMRHRLKRGGGFGAWVAVAIALLMILWVPTGLFGFQPTVVAGESMTPFMKMGDVAITVSTNVENLKGGDVIVYMRQGSQQLIIHRVVEISKAVSGYTVVTKGDANNAADPPIIVSGAVSKVVYLIPQVGWASIYLKAWVSEAGAALTANTLLIYSALVLLFGAFSIVCYKHYMGTRRRFSV